MKFKISRTSGVGVKPCDEAGWDDDNNMWAIEVASLEEICALEEKYGALILSRVYGPDAEGTPWLEIYDDYAE